MSSPKEVIMIIGPTATGKSTVAEKFIKSGYEKVNRDSIGGKLENIIPIMKSHLQNGKNVVLDNTHLAPDKRKDFIQAAKKCKANIKCLVMNTKIEDAQINFSLRVINQGININDIETIKNSCAPNIFPPLVMFRHYKDFIKPTLDEGFDSVEEILFVREWPDDFTNKAILVDFDSTIRITKSGDNSPKTTDDIEIMDNRYDVLSDYQKNGYVICGVSNQSQVAKGIISYENAQACYDKTVELLGIDIDYMFCPHASSPPVCWCRKPMPGYGVHFIMKYKLDPKNSIMVGDMTTDKTFAKRSGFQYVDESEFFKKRN